MSKRAPIEPDDSEGDLVPVDVMKAYDKVEKETKWGPLNAKRQDSEMGHKTAPSPAFKKYGAPDEPDDARVRDAPSGKFADKQKGINMGEIGRKWGK